MSLLQIYLDLFRRNRALGRLLAGEFISGIGDMLYLVAILVVIYQQSESPVLLGVIGAARVLPYVVLSVPAGMAADRFDRRLVLLVTDIVRGIIMLALAAAVVVGASPVAIIGLAIVAACFSTFFGPAIASLLPTLVDERDLGPANSAWATLDNLSFMIGPAIAGLLFAVSGMEAAFLINAATFAVVAVVLWTLPPVDRAPVTHAEEAAPGHAGWRGLVRPLAGPFILDAATSFVGGGISVLTVLIALDVLGAGESGTGFLNAGAGVGGVVAGIAGGALLARRLSVPLLIGGSVGGAGLAWLALSGSLLAATLAIAVATGGLLLLDVVNTTLIQRIVPDALRGRAMGVLQTSTAVLYAAGSLVMPLLATATGVPAALVVSAALIAVGVLAALALSQAGREELPAPDPARLRALDQPIFAGMPAGRIEAAARRLGLLPVSRGDVVILEGDPAHSFFIVDSGTFRVTRIADGAPVHLRDLGPGDVFGEIGLLRGVPRTATVTAASDGLLYTLDAEPFAELVGSGPGLGTRLLDLYRGALSR